MRKKFRQKEHPSIGDKRTVKKFLLVPRLLGQEFRWFETATIEQVCRFRTTCVPEMRPFVDKAWVDESFVEQEGPNI